MSGGIGDILRYKVISGDIRNVRGYQKIPGEIGISVISGDISE